MATAKGRQPISPALQTLGMQELFPTLRLVSKNPLGWRGRVTPIEGGRAFTLDIRLPVPRGVPTVRVVDPKLEAEPTTGRPPHTFPDGTLCLYHTGDFSWTGEHHLARTIVPWACEWGLFYEVWASTGKWLGPAYPHGMPKTPQRVDSERRRPDRAA